MTMNGTKKLYKKLQIVKTVKDTDWLLYLQTGSKKDKTSCLKVMKNKMSL